MKITVELPDYSNMIPFLVIMFLTETILVATAGYFFTKRSSTIKFKTHLMWSLIGMITGLGIYYIIHQIFWPIPSCAFDTKADYLQKVIKAKQLRNIFFTLPILFSVLFVSIFKIRKIRLDRKN